MRRFTTFAAATAVLMTSFAATPAEARHRYGGWGYRDRDHIGTGEVLGGLFVIGAIAAIVGAAGKDKQERREPRYEPPYPNDDNYREVPRYEPDNGGDPGNGAYGRSDESGSGAYSGGATETRAADACSWAVEAEMGDGARVDRVDDSVPNNGGWYVTGTASRSGGDTRSFGCSYTNGRVVDVNFGG
ncbi:MAG: hypothetical protein JNL35_04755 [Sphingopyxis sp.]|nr:hypothetical protein [Sphingopyxis sp.]